MKQNCYCGRSNAYTACCGKYHRGAASAPTPEDLMRSRYSAFAVGDADYLVATRHPRFVTDSSAAEIAQSNVEMKWIGLKVLDAVQLSEKKGQVEFIAFYEQAGQRGQLHERSNFQKFKGKWVYTDGELK